MKKIIIILLPFIIAGTGCKKDTTQNSVCTAATVKYYGDPAADGLGWVLLVSDSTGGHVEIPENLAGSYKTDGLAVDVCYEKTTHLFYCFCTQPYKMVNIVSIKKR